MRSRLTQHAEGTGNAKEEDHCLGQQASSACAMDDNRLRRWVSQVQGAGSVRVRIQHWASDVMLSLARHSCVAGAAAKSFKRIRLTRFHAWS